jgi:hypothetical protein
VEWNIVMSVPCPICPSPSDDINGEPCGCSHCDRRSGRELRIIGAAERAIVRTTSAARSRRLSHWAPVRNGRIDARRREHRHIVWERAPTHASRVGGRVRC